ncbi:MAG: HP0729 family protein [Arcobacteraceae bacterium]
MHNLLVLYNPYYQNDVIEQHLKVLIENEKVAFGKIRSKLKNVEHGFEDALQNIYTQTSATNPMQLFLTDYASMFVAKVIEITNEDMSHIAPPYYKEKGLEVEQWFVIGDIKELVRNDFETVRDHYLANFTTPNFGNHTYATYGNKYVYPLVVEMKQPVNYFEDSEQLYYPNVFQTKEFLEIKNNLMLYSFGKVYVNYMHPDTMNNIISAEMEYQANCHNPLYDMSSVVIKYAKTIEQEIYLFMKKLFMFLTQKNSEILNIGYNVQSKEYMLEDIFTHKPNLGTYKFLLRHPLVENALESYCSKGLKFYISKTVPYYINMIQNIRNETVHAKPPVHEDVEKLREKIIGVSGESMVLELVKTRYKELH